MLGEWTRGRRTVRWCAVLVVVWWLVTSQQSRCQHHNSRDNNNSRATAETERSQELAGARVTQ